LLPSELELTDITKYNQQLAEADMLLAGEGLHPSLQGARVSFSGGKTTVTQGPFTGTSELIAGFWLIQAKSLEEAIQWARRVPFKDGEIEIRQVFEAQDFGPAFTPGLQEAEERLRAQAAKNKKGP